MKVSSLFSNCNGTQKNLILYEKNWVAGALNWSLEITIIR